MSTSPPLVDDIWIVWVLKVAPVAVVAAMAEPLILKAPTAVAGTERTGSGPETISPAGVQGVANAPGTHAPTWITAADAAERLIKAETATDAATAKYLVLIYPRTRKKKTTFKCNSGARDTIH